MAYRIVIWDQSREGMSWIDENINENEVELIDFVSDSDDVEGVQIDRLMLYSSEWDYLIILTRRFRPEVNKILELCSIPSERVIFPLDAYSLADHSDVSKKIFLNNVERRIAWSQQKRLHDYIACTADGLTYVGPSSDNTIIAEMYVNNYNFADNEINLFYALSQKYYQFTDEQIYFCDIGANIGTTSIYFKSKIDPTVKILAIEPVEQNYRLLKANMLINGLNPEEEFIMKYAVGEVNKETEISINPGNSGGNSLIDLNTGKKETVTEKTFDSIVSECGINPKQLKYLWVDVEGFEYYFLKGAKDTLANTSAPLLMEFTPDYLRANNIFEEYVSLLNTSYSGYIMIQDPSLQIHNISDLMNYKEESIVADIFLIK